MVWYAISTKVQRVWHVQGEGLPDVSGPTARLIRSADGSVLKVQPVPPFNNAELPGNAASLM